MRVFHLLTLLLLGFSLVASQNCWRSQYPTYTIASNAGKFFSLPLTSYSIQYVLYIALTGTHGDDQIGVNVYPSQYGSPPQYCLGSKYAWIPYLQPYCMQYGIGTVTVSNFVIPVQTYWQSNPIIHVECWNSCYTTYNCANQCAFQLTVTICHNMTVPATSCNTAFTGGTLANPCSLTGPLAEPIEAKIPISSPE